MSVLAARRASEQFVDLFGGHRTAEHKALGERTAHLAQQLGLMIRFDAFGDRLEPEIANQSDDRSDQLRLTDVGSHLAHETSVDLYAVQRQPAEIRQR